MTGQDEKLLTHLAKPDLSIATYPARYELPRTMSHTLSASTLNRQVFEVDVLVQEADDVLGASNSSHLNNTNRTMLSNLKYVLRPPEIDVQFVNLKFD